jgi:(2Fe-2S) ferredoxin
MTTCKLKCYAKFYENGVLVRNINSNNLRSFKARLSGEKFDEVDIKIVYRPDEYKSDPLFNSGTFSSVSSAKMFINECTDRPLLEYMAGGAW